MADEASSKNPWVWYPASLQNAGFQNGYIQFALFARDRIDTSGLSSIIALYMPEELSIPSTVKWKDEALGAVGAGLQVTRNGGGAGAAAYAMGKSAFISGGAAAGISAAGALAKSAGVNLDEGHLKNAASAASKQTLNPYLTMIFEGVDFRKYSFRFKFTPATEADCSTIDRIIREFRAASLPNNEQGDALLKYPDEVEIAYMFNGSNGVEVHPWLKKFKRSVITGLDVSYGDGSQWTQFRNGFPTVVSLKMDLMEIDPVYRLDVLRGY